MRYDAMLCHVMIIRKIFYLFNFKFFIIGKEKFLPAHSQLSYGTCVNNEIRLVFRRENGGKSNKRIISHP